MALAENLDQLIADAQERELPAVTPRSRVLPGLPGKADVVIGMRRSGKTWLLFGKIGELLASGVSRDRILYLNFEDPRLLPLAASDLPQVLDAFYRRHPSSRGQPVWLFFDEIQNVPGWELFIRQVLDTEPASVVLTGSSARLLSREIATSLRGRSLSSELLPFSFAESLRHAGVEIPGVLPPSATRRSLLEHHFDAYLTAGGFPEVQGLAPELRFRVLQDYVDVVLFRDVVERWGVDNLPALRELQRSLLAHPARAFSIHRLFNDLKSQGIRVGKDTLHEYLGYLEDAFLLFTVEVASTSTRVRRSNPRKCYLVDPALASVASWRFGEDLGPLLENVVYLELRRRGFVVSWVATRSGREVDFLAQRPDGARLLIQVCADLSTPATRTRELRALEEAMDEQGMDEALVVTLREEDTVVLPAGQVRAVPAWRWLLEG